MANEVMPPAASLFTNENPSIELHAADLGIADLVAGVRGGTLDAAVTRPPLVDDLHSDLLGSEGVVIALPEQTRVGPQEISAVGRSCRPTGG